MAFHTTNEDWTRRCNALVAAMLEQLGGVGLRPDNFGLVALREQDVGPPQGFSHRGDWPCYPCSIVKAFHLIHALHAIDQGQVQDHPELSRAMRDMILWSSNTATNYVIDVITGTTGDTLLQGAEFDAWRDKREELNRFFRRLGWPELAGCNITQKLMDDVRYGREAQYAGEDGAYLNVLTPLAGARLFSELFSGGLPLSGAAMQRGIATLARDLNAPEASTPEYQLSEYLGGGLRPDIQVWSKAGHNLWTGDPRTSYFKHDLIRLHRAGSAPVILCLMTQGKALAADRPEAFSLVSGLILTHLLG